MEFNMTTSEEFMPSGDQSQIAFKGKSIKRTRTTSYLINICNGLESFADDDCGSATTAEEEEEEDMANCLILLAQGGGIKTITSLNDGNSSKVVVGPDHTNSSYECKTCNKSFHSFQALGGHRASHKKPKSSTTNEIVIEESKKLLFNKINNKINIINNIFNNNNSSTSIQKSLLPPSSFSSSSSKVHECSICGSEFSSGQALGGHMRRHRATPVSSLKPRSIFSLDLNLPAPEEDDDHFYGESKFHHHHHQFATNQKRPFDFSAPALVDCHY